MSSWLALYVFANGSSGGEVGEYYVLPHYKEHMSVGKEFIEDLWANK